MKKTLNVPSCARWCFYVSLFYSTFFTTVQPLNIIICFWWFWWHKPSSNHATNLCETNGGIDILRVPHHNKCLSVSSSHSGDNWSNRRRNDDVGDKLSIFISPTPFYSEPWSFGRDTMIFQSPSMLRVDNTVTIEVGCITTFRFDKFVQTQKM